MVRNVTWSFGMSTVEKRLTVLERQVSTLLQQISKLNDHSDWLDKVTGSFKDDQEFEEILRLGKEIRDQDGLNDSTADIGS
jgi:hypothetical protein